MLAANKSLLCFTVIIIPAIMDGMSVHLETLLILIEVIGLPVSPLGEIPLTSISPPPFTLLAVASTEPWVFEVVVIYVMFGWMYF